MCILYQFFYLQRHTEDVVGMDIASTGKYIITCSTANDLIVWDLKGQPLATVEMHLGSTHRARISPCGRFVAASGKVAQILLQDRSMNFVSTSRGI